MYIYDVSIPSTYHCIIDEFFLRLGLWNAENFIINLSLPELPNIKIS